MIYLDFIILVLFDSPSFRDFVDVIVGYFPCDMIIGNFPSFLP